jgi:hypothetical protein
LAGATTDGALALQDLLTRSRGSRRVARRGVVAVWVTALASAGVWVAGADKAHASEPLIFTIAGTGAPLDSNEGGVATDVGLNDISGVTVTSTGEIIIATPHVIWQLGDDGRLQRVAGVRSGGTPADGVPALQASLSNVAAVGPADDGGFLLSDIAADRVRQVAPNGTITTVAGTGAQGYSGDGGPAVQAQLSGPAGLAPAPGGGFFVSVYNYLRRVDAGGIIAPWAGDGHNGDAGDDGPALIAQLWGSHDIAARPNGAVVLSELDRLREVGSDGIIRTLAGGGRDAAAHYDGPAGGVQIFAIGVVASDDAAEFVDGEANVVRRVTHGRVNTVAGVGGAAAFVGAGAGWLNGDGQTALRARLWPFDLASATGGLLITEPTRVRMLLAPGSARLAVAIQHVTVAARGVTMAYRLTHPATARATLFVGHRAYAHRIIAPGATAGRFVLPRPRSGVLSVELRAADAADAAASDRAHLVVGARMPAATARAVLDNDLAWLAGALSPGPGLVGVAVGHCRRISDRRVDCTAEVPNDTSGPSLVCAHKTAVTLRADGLATLRDYTGSGDRCPRFARHPRWSGDGRPASIP